MIHKIRALALAFIAVGAVDVFASPAAQAENGQLHLGGENTVVTAETQTEQHIWKLGEYSIKCTNATFEGIISAKTVTDWTVTPTFSGCKANENDAHFRMNGCQYTFTGGGPKALTANLDIVNCTKGKSIEIEVTGKACILTISQQNGIGHVTYENFAGSPSHIATKFALTGVHYVEDGAACLDKNGTTGNNGELKGKTTVKGFGLKDINEVSKHGHKYLEWVCGPPVDVSAT